VNIGGRKLSRGVKLLPVGVSILKSGLYSWLRQSRNPLKDINAQVLSIKNGLKSRAEIVSELGYNVEDIDHEIAADNKRTQELGLVFDYQNKATPQKEEAKEAVEEDDDEAAND
jgi:capsid protein